MLDLVHTDLSGPMRTESMGGARYLMTFVEDSTRWTEVKFLKSKNQALDAFKSYKNLVETQIGRKIKCVQSDNGTEFCNNSFNEFLHNCGIKRRLTVAHTPQQNGVAERKNRTLVEMARCMLFEANLPRSFWAEAVATANYLRNRCPSRSLGGGIPYEMWEGKPLDLSHLRTFRCRAFTLNKQPGKGKFDQRGRECIFIGYSKESKGYRVWLPVERKIQVTRDVNFMNEYLRGNRWVEIDINSTK